MVRHGWFWNVADFLAMIHSRWNGGDFLLRIDNGWNVLDFLVMIDNCWWWASSRRRSNSRRRNLGRWFFGRSSCRRGNLWRWFFGRSSSRRRRSTSGSWLRRYIGWCRWPFRSRRPESYYLLLPLKITKDFLDTARLPKDRNERSGLSFPISFPFISAVILMNLLYYQTTMFTVKNVELSVYFHAYVIKINTEKKRNSWANKRNYIYNNVLRQFVIDSYIHKNILAK